jgi:hypothetical protein
MQMRAITYTIALEKQLGGGSILDGKTDPFAFLRITDRITDAKSARGNDRYAASLASYPPPPPYVISIACLIVKNCEGQVVLFCQHWNLSLLFVINIFTFLLAFIGLCRDCY